MKQSKTNGDKFLQTCFTDEEIQVAEILLDLGNSVTVSSWQSNLSWSWGSKRRRSALDAAPYSTLAPSSSSPSDEIEIEPPPRIKPEVQSTSPTTPLSFSPSESDEKSIRSSKTSKKRKEEKYRAEYMEKIEVLTQSKDLLIGEIENVRNHKNKLKAFNLKLRLLKQEVNSYMKEESHMGMSKFLNFEMNPAQHYQMTAVAHRQPYIVDQMATGWSSSSQIIENIHYPIIPIAPPSNGLGHLNQVGQDGLPDLNLSLEEDFCVDPSQPLDVERELADKRARFAEARRLRRGIIKNKTMKSSLGGAKLLRSR